MKKFLKPETYIALGIPILFFVGSLFHFIYNLFGNSFIVGLISPVNESVFEHTKMVVIPILLWWGIYYIFQKDQIDANKWFTSALVSMIVSIIAIPLIYYFYTEAFGVELLIVDILILFMSVLLGQLIGLHYYKYGTGIDFRLALIIMLLIVVLFALFTVNPPKLPLFKDPIAETYGIYKIV